MWKTVILFLWLNGVSSARKELSSKRGENDDDELENIYVKTNYNYSRLPTTTERITKPEVVVEKFVETLMASERYLKLIETVDGKLVHLETTFQERTNTILKYLTEVLRVTKTSPVDALQSSLHSLKNDLDKLKHVISQPKDESPKLRVETDCHLETALDNRLSFLETHMKSVASNVEVILNVISEVKSRQRSRNFNDSDQFGRTVDPTNLITEFRRVLQEQKSKKCDCKLGRVDRSERYPTDCQEIQAQGFNVTGIYKIKPDDIEPFYVLCDLSSAGGGWTVIQNRFDGSQDFYKNWIEYKHGFGNLAGEFWLGLEKTFYLTNQKLYELRVEMEGQHGQEVSATYSVFTLGPEYEGYRISTLGTFRGNAGDSLSYHAGQKFSTYDSDNDEWKDGSCAVEHGGAWWYKECDKSNLNGKYLITADESNGQSIYWVSFNGPTSPLYKTRMMIRPLPASRPMDHNEKPRSNLDGSKSQNDKKHVRAKDAQGSYDATRGRIPYRYDVLHPDGFFPNYT
ncbi:angiopoietin-related protein 4-like [Nymphalis io]|uniref:angiopoietin-related protein 4-like n=1 Tax=Inachis io TaxID=171585 RepID=UPI002168CFD0|nr:angiopoietin-related protein 4-like [Nymphalis io]